MDLKYNDRDEDLNLIDTTVSTTAAVGSTTNIVSEVGCALVREFALDFNCVLRLH